MHRINPGKLLQSKWTAVAPTHGEKHFIVTEAIRDEAGHVQQVVLQAVLTKRTFTMAWRALTDDSRWQFGWR